MVITKLVRSLSFKLIISREVQFSNFNEELLKYRNVYPKKKILKKMKRKERKKEMSPLMHSLAQAMHVYLFLKKDTFLMWESGELLTFNF